MRATALTVALALVGCDHAFSLHRPPIDAPADAPPDAPGVCDDPSGIPDEDGDGRRDACDSCPHIAALQQDTDGDGVGDACDPRPGQIDTLVRFIGFDDNSHGLSLFVDGGSGSWSVSNGALRATNVAEMQDMLARVDVSLRDVTVVAGVTLIGTNPAFVGESAGLWVNIDTGHPDPTFPVGNLYEHVRTTLRYSHLVQTRTTSPNAADSGVNSELFVPGRRYELSLTCQGVATPTCTASTQFEPNNQTITISLPSATVRNGAVGLRAYSTDVAFHYVGIYRHGP